MTKLLIIESPGKIDKLSALLGDGWEIAASGGHVRDLPAKEMGVEPPTFKPQYVLTERGATSVARLKAKAARADTVFLATDPDREGESISWHLQQCLKLSNPQRITFNEITAQAVRSALAKPRSIDTRLVAAQEARRVLDRLVGYSVSPALSRQAGHPLSAGRVQSPAVRLVVERERAIRAFKSTQHYGVRLNFSGEKSAWSAEWVTKPAFATEESPYVLDQQIAESVAAVRSTAVLSCEEREERRAPPPPFTTSTLQQAGSAKLGLDPKATMEAAQRLYEAGHITYHRTDNPNVSDESLGDIYAEAVRLGLTMADKPRRFKAKDGAQEGHPAITPTHWDLEVAGENEEQRGLYKLIRLRAIACQLADAIYAVRVLKLQATDSHVSPAPIFEARGRTLVDAGWLKLTATDATAEGEEDESENPVPQALAGDSLRADGGEVLTKKTRPPARFTLASLVAKLEAEGIGRPATYAAITDNIVSRAYIKVVAKQVHATELGEQVCDALVGRFGFMELSFTRELEEALDDIAQGGSTFGEVVGGLHARLETELATAGQAMKPAHPCPACGAALRRIKGDSGHFWGCSAHPTCKTTLPDDNGKPGSRQAAALSNFACEKCGKPLVRRLKKGKGGFDFFGCSGYREGCNASYKTVNGKPEFKNAS